MSKLINIAGETFGRLKVIRLAPNKGRQTAWFCECECGREITVFGCNLKTGNTQSCGCLRIEVSAKKAAKHGMCQSPEYKSWSAMISRCLNPKNSKFSYYGGRGITICNRWLDIKNFIADMGPKPSPELSIDRIDNDGNYELGNCRWSTATQQARNQRMRKTNTSGFVGVCQRESGNWRARITVAKETIPLGTFALFYEACEARKSAENKYWGVNL